MVDSPTSCERWDDRGTDRGEKLFTATLCSLPQIARLALFLLSTLQPRLILRMSSAASSPAYITAAELHALLVEPATRDATLVVDVRDDDFVDGHIAGALNIPSRIFQQSIDEIEEAAQGKERVVLHCMMSQQRGPACATILAQAMAKKKKEAAAVAAASEADAAVASTAPFPTIMILQSGFQGWARYLSRLEPDVRAKDRDLLLADYSQETHGYQC